MSSTQAALPAWPPAFNEEQLRALASAGTDYALAHGLVYRPLAPASSALSSLAGPPTDSVIHAPFSLLPSPFPRELFERAHGPLDPSSSGGRTESANTAHSLPALYAYVYARITVDHAFLERVIGANVAKVDEFQGELWKRYLAVREELQQSHREGLAIGHRLHLGLFRSDYLLHAPDEDPDAPASAASAGAGQRALQLKQVEFNTISASFGSLSTRAGELHRFLHTSTGAFFGAAPGQLGDAARLPPNRALRTLAAGLAAGHRAYVDAEVTPRTQRSSAHVAPPAILFVVQPGERNAFDQRWLEYELGATHGVRVLRATFDELAGALGQGNPNSGLSFGATLEGPQRTLRVRLPGYHGSSPTSSERAGTEISVVYFRAGYGPGDYPEGGHAWDIRLLLERSAAIKCPTIALQLAGAKKVQQVLAEPGVLESFLLQREPSSATDLSEFAELDEETTSSQITYTQRDVDLLRSTFSGLWPLDSRSELGLEGLRLAQAEAERFVLKPQREGGGNNVYRQDIPPFLSKLDKGGEEGYILMELIKPPRGVGNYLMRAGAGNAEGPKLAGDVVSELGIYSTALFGQRQSGPDPSTGTSTSTSLASSSSAASRANSGGLMLLHEGYGGYLLRTKGRESDEGGVAVGYSVIDSVVLV
ncbi:Glutathione synthetase [Tilletia horrida]|nr:Glutathione synthetase [Tilletia horrida]